MKRRRVIVNTVLGVVVVGIGLGAYLSVGQASSTRTATAQTVTVSKGNLTSTVTATGNAESVTSVAVDLEGDAAVVEKIYVKSGQKVAKGDKLLRVDDTTAQRDLRSAKASLASARASLAETRAGQTAAEQAQTNASLRSAETSLANSRTSLSQAKASYRLDRSQQNKLVSIARANLSSARKAGNHDAIVSAKNALTQAKQSRASALLKSRQSVQSQEGSLRSAEDQLSSAQASAAVANEPAKASEIASGQAQVDTAAATVVEARKTLSETVLRAPVAGTVSDISAVTGQSSSSSAASSSTTSSTSSTSSSSSGSSSSSSSSGLVTLTDLDHKQIEASVAEADITKVKVGEKVSIVFSATEKTVTGTVSEIDTDDTVTNNVVTYGVTVTIDDNAKSIRVGQSASMTITTGSASDVLIAPTSAITTVGTRSTVTRRVNGVDSTVSVETGLVGTAGTEITSGLAEGDVLVVPTTTSTTSGNTFPTGGGLGGIGGGR